MYSVNVSSDQNRRSSGRRYNNRFSDYRSHQRRPSIRISNANQLLRYVRDNLFNLCSSQSKAPDREYEEFIKETAATISSKPEKLDVLCELTKFTRRELKIMYREFKNECPDGILKEDMFKSIYQQFFPKGTESSSYAHFVFCSFDLENTGTLTFTDFILGLSVLLRGTITDKLNWLFRFYDTKKKGFLEKEDFQRILNSIYEMMRSNSKASNESSQIDEKEHLDLVFQKFGVYQTGGVCTSKQFIQTCMEDNQIISSLQVMNTVI